MIRPLQLTDVTIGMNIWSCCKQLIIKLKGTCKEETWNLPHTWKECVVNDIKKLRLKQEDAQDRAVWRDGILWNRASAEKTDVKSMMMIVMLTSTPVSYNLI